MKKIRKFKTTKYHHQFYGETAQNHWWSIGRYTIIPNFVIRESRNIFGNSDDEKRLLDLGAGTGEMMLQLSSHFSVRGIDLNQQKVKKTKKGNVVITYGDACNIPYKDSSFDIITAFDLLEHFADDKKILRHWSTKLKENGLLFLSVPAYQWLWSVDDIIAGHRRRYSAPELKVLLEASGFKIIRITYFNFWLFPIAAIVKVWKRIRLNFNSVSDEELFNNFGFHIGYNRLINPLLAKIFTSEEFLLRYFNLPYGVSILVCAQKI